MGRNRSSVSRRFCVGIASVEGAETASGRRWASGGVKEGKGGVGGYGRPGGHRREGSFGARSAGRCAAIKRSVVRVPQDLRRRRARTRLPLRAFSLERVRNLFCWCSVGWPMQSLQSRYPASSCGSHELASLRQPVWTVRGREVDSQSHPSRSQKLHEAHSVEPPQIPVPAAQSSDAETPEERRPLQYMPRCLTQVTSALSRHREKPAILWRRVYMSTALASAISALKRFDR